MELADLPAKSAEHLESMHSREPALALTNLRKDPPSIVLEPRDSGAQALVPTRALVVKARLQSLALYWTMLVTGWSDGSAGPMLPLMQTVYHVKFAVVSLIFVFACIGYISGAAVNVYLSERMKFGKVLVLGRCSVLQMVSYSLQAPALPFPAFVMLYSINGVGMTLQLAQVNEYVATMDANPSSKVEVLHAAYGAGALSAPLVATQFAQLPRWSFHYLVSLGLSTFNTIFLSAIFRLKSKDECRAEISLGPAERGESPHSPFRQIFSLRSVHILAMFIFVYVGIEVTIGVDCHLHHPATQRGADSGYISSGFFAGLMIGRVILLPVFLVPCTR